MQNTGRPTHESLSHRIAYCSLGAFLTSLVVTPLDVARIRLQSGGAAMTSSSTWRSMWKGLTPTVALMIPSSSLYIILYESTRDFLVTPSTSTLASDNLLTGSAVAGLFARSLTVAITSPLELLRTRSQQTGNESTSTRAIIQSLSSMVRQRGLRYLWTGLVPTIWRDVPFSAVYWSGYEFGVREMDRIIESGGGILKYHWQSAFIAGGISGMFASLLTHPFDVAKTLIQMDRGRLRHSLDSIHAPSADSQSPKVGRVIAGIYKTEGWAGLWHGLIPRLVKISPAAAIMIATYEYGKNY